VVDLRRLAVDQGDDDVHGVRVVEQVAHDRGEAVALALRQPGGDVHRGAFPWQVLA
jgi:hypothetical protein